MADSHIQYWPLPLTGQDHGHIVELRAKLAWELIHQYGVIAAKPDGEDSGHRQQFVLQQSEELVDRCFAIADAFVERSEARQELRAIALTEEEAFQHAGYLRRLGSRAEYPIEEMPQLTLTAEELEMRARHRQEREALREKLREQKPAGTTA